MGLSSERRILIVDDEPGIREIVVCNLMGAGISASISESGQEAKEIIKEAKESGGPIDLLTDLDGVDGIDIARNFRKTFPRELYPDLCVFLMTASREAKIPDGLFDGMFYKPFDPWLMVEKIRNARNLLAVAS